MSGLLSAVVICNPRSRSAAVGVAGNAALVYRCDRVYRYVPVYRYDSMYRYVPVYRYDSVYRHVPVYRYDSVYQYVPVYRYDSVYRYVPVYRYDSVYRCGKRLHTPPFHPVLSEAQGFS